MLNPINGSTRALNSFWQKSKFQSPWQVSGKVNKAKSQKLNSQQIVSGYERPPDWRDAVEKAKMTLTELYERSGDALIQKEGTYLHSLNKIIQEVQREQRNREIPQATQASVLALLHGWANTNLLIGYPETQSTLLKGLSFADLGYDTLALPALGKLGAEHLLVQEERIVETCPLVVCLEHPDASTEKAGVRRGMDFQGFFLDKLAQAAGILDANGFLYISTSEKGGWENSIKEFYDEKESPLKSLFEEAGLETKMHHHQSGLIIATKKPDLNSSSRLLPNLLASGV